MNGKERGLWGAKRVCKSFEWSQGKDTENGTGEQTAESGKVGEKDEFSAQLQGQESTETSKLPNPIASHT